LLHCTRKKNSSFASQSLPSATPCAHSDDEANGEQEGQWWQAKGGDGREGSAGCNGGQVQGQASKWGATGRWLNDDEILEGHLMKKGIKDCYNNLFPNRIAIIIRISKHPYFP
jgi:hypothetical protein